MNFEIYISSLMKLLTKNSKQKLKYLINIKESKDYKRLLFFMINILINLGSKESLSVNFKDGICAEMCL